MMMRSALNRVLVGSMVVVALVLAGADRAQAATATIQLVPVTSQDVDIQLPPNNEFKVLRSTVGNVLFNGATIGTYTMRQEFDLVTSSSTTTPYPTPLVTITVRLDPPVGTRFDVLIMQGTVPGVASPDNITIFGNVAVATGNLAFLKTAIFTMSTNGGPGVPLTLTF
jgi:hypothetical protein